MFPTLTPGDYRGKLDQSAVVFVQTILRVKADAQFGPKTAEALRRWQVVHGVDEDGIVGPRTWAALAPRIVQPVYLRGDGVWSLSPVGAPFAALGDLPKFPKTQKSAAMLALYLVGLRENPKVQNEPWGALKFWVDGYREFRQTGTDGYPPWCAIFASSVTRVTLGLPNTAAGWRQHPFKNWLGGVAEIEAIGLPVLAEPEMGCIFTQGRNGSGSDPSTRLTAGHTGIVVAVDGDLVWSVDGNVDDRVALCARRKGQFRKFLRWGL